MSEEKRVPNRRPLYLIAAIATAPLLVACLLHQFWRPTSFTNYGQLLPPAPIADAPLRQADGSPFKFSDLKGKWVFLTVDSGRCEAACRDKLYKMRQVRLTQGEKMNRIERAWLIDDDIVPAEQIRKEYKGTQQVFAKDSTVIGQLPAEASVRDHIYIVDPLGNVMMRYGKDADPTGIKKDVTRLLKLSRIG